MTYTDAVTVDRLTVTRGSVTVLDGLDLRVDHGIHALLGPNGAGKSTLVGVLSTLLPARTGTARVFGHDVAREPALVRRLIGVTGQFPSVDDLLTGRENLVMTGRLLGLGRRGAARRASALLDRLELADLADRRVATLSGGQRRRLDLATSLVRPPALLILDEPTTGLDITSRTRLWEEVRDLASRGTTVLLTTQYLEEADALARHVWVLHGGRIVADGTSEHLKDIAGGTTLQALDHAGRAVRSEATDGSLTAVTRTLQTWAADPEASALRVAVRRPSLDEAFVALTSAPVSPDLRTPPRPRGAELPHERTPA